MAALRRRPSVGMLTVAERRLLAQYRRLAPSAKVVIRRIVAECARAALLIVSIQLAT